MSDPTPQPAKPAPAKRPAAAPASPAKKAAPAAAKTEVAGAAKPAAKTPATPVKSQEDLVLTKVAAAPAAQEKSMSESDYQATRIESAQTVHDAPKGESREPSMPALADEAKAKNLSTLKDFRLIKKLGEGGMGAVYKAHQISLDRTVAIKVPFKHLCKDPSFIQRFYREARVMAKLDHPNILRCFSVGEENGWHYLAMEYIDGASMQAWLEKLKKLSVGDAVHVALACAHALQHAHEAGLIHRDIKPDNILVTSKGVVKVADLGLAKALADDMSLSRTGTGAGTPHYMSPEQARDAKHVDHRCDIYALGTMLYVFLAGKPPFAGETYVELLMAKDSGKYASLRKLNPEVPEKLDLMIGKAIQVKPDLRYKSCAELIKDLESLAVANETLSFIPGATATILHAAGGATKTAGPGKPTVPAKPGAAPAGKPGVPGKPGAAGKPAGVDLWYLSLTAASGNRIKRKLTTAQVIAYIKSKAFNAADSEASRNFKGPYKKLAFFREFEHALQGRLTQEKAARKTEKLQGMYQDIMATEKSFYFKRWLGNQVRNVTSWIMFLVLLGVLGAGLYYGYIYLWPSISHFFQQASNG